MADATGENSIFESSEGLNIFDFYNATAKVEMQPETIAKIRAKIRQNAEEGAERAERNLTADYLEEALLNELSIGEDFIEGRLYSIYKLVVEVGHFKAFVGKVTILTTK